MVLTTESLVVWSTDRTLVHFVDHMKGRLKVLSMYGIRRKWTRSFIQYCTLNCPDMKLFHDDNQAKCCASLTEVLAK